MSSTLQAVTAATALVGSYIPPQVAYPSANDGVAVPRWQLAAESSHLLKSSPVGASYFEKRLPESCYYPLEVVVIQDSTYSFQDDFPTMINSELDQMFDGITANHPGSTFAVASHTDKPITPFGWPETPTTYGDWCWKIEQPLSPNRADLTSTYSRMVATGGNDLPENQYGCIVNAVQSKKLGWGSNPDAARLIVVSTDSPPHWGNDGNSQQGMANFSGVFDEDNADKQCVEEYYPTPTQAIDAVLDTSSGQIPPYVAFIVFDGAELPNNETIGSWQWYANQIREDNRFVRDRTANSDNFWEQLSSIIGVIDSLECRGATTSSSTTTATTTGETTTSHGDTRPTTTAETTTVAITTEAPTTDSTTSTSETMTTHGDPHFTTTIGDVSTPSSTPPTTTTAPTTQTTAETTVSETTVEITTATTAETTATTTTATTTRSPCPCPCPKPCPSDCDCKCGESVYLRYPKNVKNVDLHIDYRRV